MGSELKWSEDYCVNIETMDEQHEELIEIANDLCTLANENSDNEEISNAFNYLLAYANYHLVMEEMVMSRSDYPDYAAHMNAHNVYRNKVNDLKETFTNGDTGAAKQAAIFLINWLQEHIRVVDRAFAEFLNETHGHETAKILLSEAYHEVSSASI